MTPQIHGVSGIDGKNRIMQTATNQMSAMLSSLAPKADCVCVFRAMYPSAMSVKPHKVYSA